MNLRINFVNLILIFYSGFTGTHGYKILGVFPMNSRSHHNLFEPLMKGLANRGHEVDVITHFELENPPNNYRTIINLHGTRPSLVNNFTIDFASKLGSDPVPYIAKIYGNELCELMSLEEMQRFIKNPPKNHSYDLLITEAFGANCYIGLGYILKVPVITVSTIREFSWTIDAIGNPPSTAFSANVLMDSGFVPTFWGRLKNTFIFHYSKYRFHRLIEKEQTEAMRKYLHPNIPTIREVEKSVALTFSNSYHSLFGTRPLTPALIEIAGLHVEQNDAILSPELNQWMDKSTQGVVYFSLGSMVVVESLPEDILLAFYAAFSKIAPTRVLMRIINTEKLPPGLPHNVKTLPWIPQVPVLKHKNTIVFITHGGLMGTQEALYCGVPMIGIPLFTDQFSNVEVYVMKNMAIRMDLDKISEKVLDKTLSTIMNDPNYKQSAMRESRRFRDRPMSVMDTVNFWVEFVIRNGKNALRSPAIDLYWWQVELLDVYGFLLLCCLIIVYFIIAIIKIIILRIFRILKVISQIKKKHD